LIEWRKQKLDAKRKGKPFFVPKPKKKFLFPYSMKEKITILQGSGYSKKDAEFLSVLVEKLLVESFLKEEADRLMVVLNTTILYLR
jgi:hypothetical protein